MKTYIYLLILCSFSVVFSFDGDSHDFYLPNGMKVILMEKFSKDDVSIGVYYNVGSKNEIAGQKGINSIVKDIYTEERKNQFKENNINIKYAEGYSNLDYTGFLNEISKEHLNDVLKIEAERMQNTILNINEEKIKRFTKKNILKLKRMDSGPYIQSEFELFPKDHPYRYSHYGVIEHLENLETVHCQDFYKQFYTPNNAILILVGNFNLKDITSMIFSHFSSIEVTADIKSEINYKFSSNGQEIKRKAKSDVPFPLPVQLQGITFYLPLPPAKNHDLIVFKHLVNILQYDLYHEKYFFDKLTKKQKYALINEHMFFNTFGNSIYLNKSLNLGESKSKVRKLKKSLISLFHYIESNGISEDILLSYKKRKLKEFYINNGISFKSINENIAYAELGLGNYKLYEKEYKIIFDLNNNQIKGAISSLFKEEDLIFQNVVIGKAGFIHILIKPIITIFRRFIPVKDMF